MAAVGDEKDDVGGRLLDGEAAALAVVLLEFEDIIFILSLLIPFVIVLLPLIKPFKWRTPTPTLLPESVLPPRPPILPLPLPLEESNVAPPPPLPTTLTA